MNLRTAGRLIFLFLLAYTLVIIFNFKSLPEQLPFHMKPNGKLEKYADKEWIFMIPLLNLLMVLADTYFIRKPQGLNYGMTVTPKNQDYLYKQMQWGLTILSFIITLVFALLTVGLYISNDRSLILSTFIILGVVYLTLLLFTIKKTG